MSLALFRYKSLRFRINASIIIVCVFLALLTAVTVIPYEKKRRENRLLDIRALINAVYQQKKETLANELFSGQLVALKKSLEDMRTVNQIARIDLYDLNGAFLLSTGTERLSALEESQRRHVSASPAFSKTSVNGHSYAVYLSLIEIIGEKVGYIRILYDLKAMEHEFHITAFFLSALLVGALLGGGVFSNLLLTYAVIRPTAKLSSAIRKVRQGQLGEQVAIDTEDEIGSMARDFNDMSKRLHLQNKELVAAIGTKESYAGQLKAINAKLEVLNAELEERVAERTAELQQMYEQLEREMAEREMADEANRQLQEQLSRSQKMEALGLLAGGVAHDLNNVLSGIVSYPELLLLQLEEDSTLRKPILVIQKSGQKAAAIVQDLLTLARRGVVTKDVVCLNDIVTAYLDAPEHRRIMDHHPGIEVQTDLAVDAMPVFGSHFHITKTVMNLVSNAAEAQPNGGRIRIATENRYIDKPEQRYERIDEGEYVVLRVSDKGGGIADVDIGRIFEPFYTKKILGRSGTGLGMAVVWGTMQDHNGFIDVRSRPGQGTTFELFFPATRKKPKAAEDKPPVDALKGNGETILVVDDVAEQRLITTQILSHLDYQAVAVESGEAAVAYLTENAVALVLLDMIMEPGIDGLETYRRMIALRPGQRAIIVSGFAENDRVREALGLGAGAYIRKPFSLEKLGGAIRRELRRT